MGASEPDKSLSWEMRKKHTIEETRNLPLRNKLVICADKINNLEDLMLKFQKVVKETFQHLTVVKINKDGIIRVYTKV